MSKKNPDHLPSSSSTFPSDQHPHTPTQTTLDTSIWCRLPPSLFDRILHFLPAPAFFRLQLLSCRIRSLLFSPSFLHSHILLSPLRPSFAFFPNSNPSSLYLLDPTSLSWHHLPLAPLLPSHIPVAPAASSAGLLCFVSLTAGPKTLLLINPLSKLIANLPQNPTPRLSPAIGLSVGPSSLSVVIAGDNLISPFSVKNLSSEMFFADTTPTFSPWSLSSPLPRLCSIEPNRMVFSSGKFYCMSVSPYAVLVYDQVSNSWSHIQPPMRRYLRSPSLVEFGEGVGLVAAVEKNRLNVPRSVRVWSLQPCGHSWVEISRMLVDVHARFYENCGGGESTGAFECAGHGGLIAFVAGTNSEVLLFDMPRREWRWAPSCRYPCEGGLKVFAYEPRIATPAIGLLTMAS
ncbi:Protein UNUSUAL FLORAL ORGANS [Rhynchospora pubera]|uniref:Protein UNUSUAL FLORAL ORGANS n=1 Tax=Rhynchospora pubera TaxID=906938 RepID=A0AAV8CT46_9POAL|nr:Protein UNUSUAL FLORAL ORGANS [Rhynchospora pubera]